MEFGNPIVGAEDLIRSAIKSPDFTTDPESGNVTGWRIARDGSATFYNLTIGSENFNIDESGNAVFQSVSASEILLNGSNLQEMLDALPRGMVAVNSLSNSGIYNGTNDLLVGRIVIPNYDPTRYYEIGWMGRVDMGASGTYSTYIDHKMYYRWDAVATDAHTQFADYQLVRRNPSSAADSGYDVGINVIVPFGLETAAGTNLNISAYLNGNAAGFQLQNTVNPRFWVKDIGPYQDLGAWTGAGGGVNPPQTYTKTYAANGSASFQSDGDNRGIAECYQGYYSGTNGNQFSLISFPYSTIQSDLSGATVKKTELYLNNNHFYANSGGTAIIGTHNQTSVSGDHSSSQVNDNLDTETFSYGQAKWFTVTNTIGNAFKNNTAKGIALGPAPSNSQSYYAYFAGNGQSGEPQLRITYTK